MNTLAIIGAQWGDEGKGKITDYLAKQADYVVRYQGGNNAGHTIKFGGQTHALHLVPSGIFQTGTKNVLANGMVIDPVALCDELSLIEAQGFSTGTLHLSDRAHIVMPYHRALDRMFESFKKEKVGTTSKGIGPAYSDKALRRSVRLHTYTDETRLKTHLKENLPHVNALLKEHGFESYDIETLIAESRPIGQRLKPYVNDTSLILNEALNENKTVLFEGAQGTMLCLDHGTYPFVTASSPTAAGIPLGAGVPPHVITRVLGIVKAYTTRVGGGPFPTEIEGDSADSIRERGNEYGTTTGRPRRIGWLDAVQLKHSCRVNGFTGIALTLLDVLSGLDTLKIATAYDIDGKTIRSMPADPADLARVIPIYETLPGFKEDLSQVRLFSDLPKEAITYIEKIESLLDVPVQIFSVGPSREETVVRANPYKAGGDGND